MPDRARRRGAPVALVAAMLLPGCARGGGLLVRGGAHLARQRNGLAGAAILLMVVLALRHVRDARGPGGLAGPPLRGWGSALPVPLPGMLVAAAVASEVVGSALVGWVGYCLGYALGPTPPHDESFTAFVGFVVAVPVVALAAVLAARLVGLPPRLPDVPHSSLVLAVVVHGVVAVPALAAAFDTAKPYGRSHVVGGAVAVAGLVGVFGYVYALGVRAALRDRARGA